MMGIYVIAQISITNSDAYNRYQAAFMNVFSKFKGKFPAADANPKVIEGDWNREKVVLMYFPDESSLQEWVYSPEYREISKDRQAGSEGVVLSVKAINL